jgi:hypothetical protein
VKPHPLDIFHVGIVRGSFLIKVEQQQTTVEADGRRRKKRRQLVHNNQPQRDLSTRES